MAEQLSPDPLINGEAFAYFRWHCLKWPGISVPPMIPCRFESGWMCADMWRKGERK